MMADECAPCDTFLCLEKKSEVKKTSNRNKEGWREEGRRSNERVEGREADREGF